MCVVISIKNKIHAKKTHQRGFSHLGLKKRTSSLTVYTVRRRQLGSILENEKNKKFNKKNEKACVITS